MTDQLKVDLEALGKLSPQLHGMSDKLSTAAASPGTVKEGDNPSLVAARKLVQQAIPDLQKAFAGRCSNVADFSVQAKNGFGDTDEHLRQLIQSATGLAR
ncbi:Uncharacterised protein [Mycobacteroides abscessus subsp. abscessus]|uniref:hypothetical protein n=1 Tax=Mycobacteroides abscessus TaxID=36809 RepID=UPI00092B522C|nr:hypothetical protein [Mycobacteroides abscessus]SIG37863.1 Uncharacterised protein [Mycobacteroides abscessus subsp. abscessus]SLI42704.1 Uncharacterised protein [Mycobacteroides abscessus subsp. abscessus]